MITPLVRVPLATSGPHLPSSHQWTLPHGTHSTPLEGLRTPVLTNESNPHLREIFHPEANLTLSSSNQTARKKVRSDPAHPTLQPKTRAQDRKSRDPQSRTQRPVSIVRFPRASRTAATPFRFGVHPREADLKGLKTFVCGSGCGCGGWLVTTEERKPWTQERGLTPRPHR